MSAKEEKVTHGIDIDALADMSQTMKFATIFEALEKIEKVLQFADGYRFEVGLKQAILSLNKQQQTAILSRVGFNDENLLMCAIRTEHRATNEDKEKLAPYAADIQVRFRSSGGGVLVFRPEENPNVEFLLSMINALPKANRKQILSQQSVNGSSAFYLAQRYNTKEIQAKIKAAMVSAGLAIEDVTHCDENGRLQLVRIGS